MASARKRAALVKAHAESYRLQQQLAVSETMVNIWKAAAEYAANVANERLNQISAEREACAKLCEDAGAAMAWSVAVDIRKRAATV